MRHYLVISSFADYGGQDGILLEDVETDFANDAVLEAWGMIEPPLQEKITDMVVLTIEGGEEGWALPNFSERPWWGRCKPRRGPGPPPRGRRAGRREVIIAAAERRHTISLTRPGRAL